MNTEAFFKITYGLYIVSSGNSTLKNGYIANTAFQVTAEPPQIAIACNKDNYTASLIEKTKVFFDFCFGAANISRYPGFVWL